MSQSKSKIFVAFGEVVDGGS